MPVYQCTIQPGAVPDDVKSAVAQEITRVHCEVTGAPMAFVHVVFHELPVGQQYLAGKVDDRSTLIEGTIRSGRTLEQRQRILRDVSAAWSRLTGQSEDELLLSIVERNASEVMEAGLIMPEPGEEAAWFEANRERLGFLLDAEPAS